VNRILLSAPYLVPYVNEYRHYFDRNDVELIVADVRERLSEKELLHYVDDIDGALADVKPEAVMHFAAFALVPESMRQPELYFRNNVVGGINLADAILKHGVERIVFSSTCATYGQPDRVPITEDEKQKPTNPYGESKLMLERALTWHRELHGLKPVYLRYFNACGATARCGEDHTPETHIIPIVLQVALGQREKVTIYGDDYATPDGSCIRDYIHIVDLAQAHMLALTTEHCGAYNLGTGVGYSVKEVVETARRITGHAIPADIGPRRPGDPARLVAAADKARRVLGWQPAYPQLETIIESAWEWHRRFPNGYGETR